MRRLGPLAAERSIVIDADASNARVRVDRVRLEQALANLLSNAVRLGPSGSHVEIVADIDQGRLPTLDVRVLDRGPGVPPAMQPRLFVPFAARSVGNGNGNGTGLGLATAAAAVKAHGGEIGYCDRPGGGSIFWFRVPA